MQKTSFQGVSVEEAKRVVFSSSSLVGEVDIDKSVVSKRGLEINGKTAAGKNIEVEVDKPLGLTLGQKQGGGVVITVSQSVHHHLYHHTILPAIFMTSNNILILIVSLHYITLHLLR